MVEALSKGAINYMLRQLGPKDVVLQILSFKKLTQQGRYRCKLSDGLWEYPTCMLGTQMNTIMEDGSVQPNQIVVVKKHCVNMAPNGKPVIIVVEVEPRNNPGVQLGSPELWSEDVAPVVTSLPPELSGASTVHSGSSVQTESETAAAASASRATGSATTTTQRVAHPGAADVKRTDVTKDRAGGIGGHRSSDTGGTQPPANIFPIVSLTPYQNKWSIRACVTSKSFRPYKNSRGEGKVMSVDLADESGEIRATAFNDVAERLERMLQQHSVYYISRGTLKPANRVFSSINNDYELMMNQETSVIPCLDEKVTKNVPQIRCSFVKISQIPNAPKDRVIDVIGVVSELAELTTLVARSTQQELKKREVTIMDDSGASISLTLWRQEAEDFHPEGNPILAVRGVRVQDFMGAINLGVMAQTVLLLNPDIPEAYRLRSWYDARGSKESGTITALSARTGGSGGSAPLTYFSFIYADRLGHGDTADYVTVKATVMQIKKENCMYQACSSANCNKKVVDMENGSYRCEKCQRESTSFKWRLMVQMLISDFTDGEFITCFQDSAEAVLGKTAEELGKMRDNDPDQFNEVFNKATFKTFMFQLRAKVEIYNDEARLKLVCVDAQSVQYAAYLKHLQEKAAREG
jgi:replication factor A1